MVTSVASFLCWFLPITILRNAWWTPKNARTSGREVTSGQVCGGVRSWNVILQNDPPKKKMCHLNIMHIMSILDLRCTCGGCSSANVVGGGSCSCPWDLHMTVLHAAAFGCPKSSAFSLFKTLRFSFSTLHVAIPSVSFGTCCWPGHVIWWYLIFT